MNILKNLIGKFFGRRKTKMEKDIMEQPEIIEGLIKRYINKDKKINIELPESFSKIYLAASGSSYNSAAAAAYFIENKTGIEARAFYASETAINPDFKTDDDTLYIFISQSGETADTNAALDKIRAASKKTFAVTNTKNSKLYNNTEYKMLIHAGQEKAAAAVKTMTAQTFCLFLTALKIMERKQIPYNSYLDELLKIPGRLREVYTLRPEIKQYAETIKTSGNIVVLSSGMFYPLAKEGALKIKETSYININAYPSGEFLHGHIALLNKKCTVIMLIFNEHLEAAADILMKINEKYKSDLMIITNAPVNSSDKQDFLQLKASGSIEFFMSALAVLQLAALETALLLDKNPDKPAGLLKIVK